MRNIAPSKLHYPLPPISAANQLEPPDLDNDDVCVDDVRNAFYGYAHPV